MRSLLSGQQTSKEDTDKWSSFPSVTVFRVNWQLRVLTGLCWPQLSEQMPLSELYGPDTIYEFTLPTGHDHLRGKSFANRKCI